MRIIDVICIAVLTTLWCLFSDRLIKRRRNKRLTTTIDYCGPERYYITGDKHRHFERLIEFCHNSRLRKEDVIIILGDSSINYYGDERDDKLKKKLSKINVTLFCIQGNKENRAENILTYGIRTFHGGTVYYEPQYPNIFFAKDGEIYDFDGKEFLVIGGAHSVDKQRCIAQGLPYFADEMPSCETKTLVENKLLEHQDRIYGFLTHTCPISVIPREMFVSTKRAAKEEKHSTKKHNEEYPLDIDRSTEEWLQTLMDRVDFEEWYCGHYHVEKDIGKIHMLHKQIVPFGSTDTQSEKGGWRWSHL